MPPGKPVLTYNVWEGAQQQLFKNKRSHSRPNSHCHCHRIATLPSSVRAHVSTTAAALLTVKQHALVVMVVVLLRHLLLPVAEPLPQLLVDNLLNLRIKKKEAIYQPNDRLMTSKVLFPLGRFCFYRVLKSQFKTTDFPVSLQFNQ